MANDMPPPVEPKQEGLNHEVQGPPVVEIIKRLKQESKDARFPREMEWNRSWNLYNGIYDFTRKADWQSKNSLPKVNTAVRAGAYLLKRGLVGPRDFYQTDGIGTISKMIAPYAHKTCKFQMERRGADNKNFVNHYITALMSGMLSSLVIMKVYPTMESYDDVQYEWPKGGPAFPSAPPTSAPYSSFLSDGVESSKLTRKRRKRLKINYDPVNAYDFYPDPRGEGMYRIHTVDLDFYKLVQMEKDGKIKAGTCDLIKEDFVNISREQQQAARQGQFAPYANYTRKRCTLDEFWGTLVDPTTGKVLFENCYALMVNEKYMAVDPKPNPLPTKRDPFLVAPIIEKPFSTWHQGFVESVAGLAESLTDLMNLILDGNQYASIKAFELDIDQVYDPTEFANGIVAGKVFKKRAGGMERAPMIKDISLGNFNPQVLEIFQMLDRELQGGMGLSEFIVPQMGGQGGRRTATEMMKKSQDSADFFGEIAKCQEENMIEPAIELSYMYTLHYQKDFDDPLLVEVLGPEVASKASLMLQDEELREFLISNPLKFRAFGMSEISRRMKELDKIMAFINLAGNFAKVDPTVLQRLKINNLFAKAIQAFNWDQDEVINMAEMPMAPMPMGQRGAPGQPPPPTAGLPPNAPPNPSVGVSGMQGPTSVG